MALASNPVTGSSAVDASPYGIAQNPAGTRAYVANQSSNTVDVIDTASSAVVGTVPVDSPFEIALNPAGARL